MVEQGISAQTWLTMVGVLVVFFVLPGIALEYDRRKRLRLRRATRSRRAEVEGRDRRAA